jgi:hypothetical protein
VLHYSAMTNPRGEIGGDRMRPVYPFETVGAPPTTKPSEPSPTGSSASSTAASPTNASTTRTHPRRLTRKSRGISRTETGVRRLAGLPRPDHAGAARSESPPPASQAIRDVVAAVRTSRPLA